MKVQEIQIGSVLQRFVKGLCITSLTLSSWSQAQEANDGPVIVESIEYFFSPVSDVQPHPSISGIGNHGRRSPLEIWSGANNSAIRLTADAEIAYFGQNASWFGDSTANLGEHSSNWWETSLTPGITGSFFTDRGDEFYGKVDLVATATTDIDAAGSNVDYGDTSHVAVDHAYVGWRSGTLWSDLGKDFLSVSVGRQQYIAGTGFLIYDQSSNGGKRGGDWLGDRKAADMSGLVQINYKDLAVDLIYFKADDQDASTDPDHHTKVGGVTLDYALGDFGGIGGGFYTVSSEAKPRDGMDVYDLRFNITPFKAFMPDSWAAPLVFEGEYVYEDNGDALEASGWYLSGKYKWDDAAWSPSLTYRYTAFEGGEDADGKSRNFDPLFYGFYDWGYWFQGEILGEWVLTNSNLNTSMVRLGLNPTSSVHVNLFYYHNELDDASAFGVSSDSYGDEWNVTVDWTANDYLSFSLVGAYVNPDDAAIESTGGDDDWYYMMFYTKFSFN